MDQKNNKSRKTYSLDFKTKAAELAKSIGTKQAAEKLRIRNFQTLSTWIRYSQKIERNDDFKENQQLRAEIKKLKKQTEDDKKTIALLRDVTVFFCKEEKK